MPLMSLVTSFIMMSPMTPFIMMTCMFDTALIEFTDSVKDYALPCCVEFARACGTQHHDRRLQDPEFKISHGGHVCKKICNRGIARQGSEKP